MRGIWLFINVINRERKKREAVHTINLWANYRGDMLFFCSFVSLDLKRRGLKCN